MDHYVVFRNSKRVSLRDEDMTAEKLSRIFQVSANTVYLTDDSNVALFPGGVSGVFSTLDLTPKAHYEVHGEDMDSTPAGSTSQRFAFMRTPAAASAGSASQRVPPSPSTATKTFQRSVYLAEVVGGRLIPNRMVVVRFLECDASLQGIVGKVQDAIGNYNPIILTDAQGNAILESEGTTHIMEEPMLSLCCRSIIGCKTCVEQWKETSPHCAQCREVNNRAIEVAGLTAAFSVFKSFFMEE
ncbi:uncharacterized protein DAT39_018599 [Clarias magur]|uniref:RING-type domain-containing protein n=1 Tax=Clarias magur TaxID=1594786 RepID=A0A8J4X2R1_CLAMG|nr:uncharacterized protein DAT39_018599 [Clarias magur]